MIKQLQELLKSDHWLRRFCILSGGVFYSEPCMLKAKQNKMYSPNGWHDMRPTRNFKTAFISWHLVTLTSDHFDIQSPSLHEIISEVCVWPPVSCSSAFDDTQNVDLLTWPSCICWYTKCWPYDLGLWPFHCITHQCIRFEDNVTFSKANKGYSFTESDPSLPQKCMKTTLISSRFSCC